jgi:hypothetical protein
VNSKWHYKIKLFNVRTAATTSSGLLKNRSFIRRRALTHLFAVRIAEQKLVQTSTEDRAAVETGDQDNLSQSHVPIVEQKILYHFSQEAISQFFAEIVSKNKEKDKSEGYQGYQKYQGYQELLASSFALARE